MSKRLADGFRKDPLTGFYVKDNITIEMNSKTSGKIYVNRHLVYDGKLKSRKPNGDGTEFLADGQYYQGKFKNGQRNGKGALFSENGIIILEGTYANGKKNGKFKRFNNQGLFEYFELYKNDRESHCPDGTQINPKTGNCIKVKSSNTLKKTKPTRYQDPDMTVRNLSDKRDFGEIFLEKDLFYRGGLKNDIPHGKGKLYATVLSMSDTSRDNQIYFEGTFKYGRRNGPGKQYFLDKSSISGTWKNDKRDGKIKFENPDGSLEKIVPYRDGKVMEAEQGKRLNPKTGNFVSRLPKSLIPKQEILYNAVLSSYCKHAWKKSSWKVVTESDIFLHALLEIINHDKNIILTSSPNSTASSPKSTTSSPKRNNSLTLFELFDNIRSHYSYDLPIGEHSNQLLNTLHTDGLHVDPTDLHFYLKSLHLCS